MKLELKKFTHYKQPDQMDCGPTCLRMIAKHYGRNYGLQRLREICGITKNGVSMLGISEAAEKIGFRTSGVRTAISTLSTIDLPCVLHWRQNHFVVLYRITVNRSEKKKTFFVADPALGLVKFDEPEFARCWISTRDQGEPEGIVLTVAPTPDFYVHQDDGSGRLNLRHFLSYLSPYKKLIVQLFLGLGVGSLLQLVLPFMMQSLVDVGINTKNLNFVYIILFAQGALFLGRLSVDLIRSWILLHISARMNIAILTDFLIKLFKLPLNFFETKMLGDLMQRMEDQNRIQAFLTGSSLGTIFSLFNLILFTFVLAYYDLSIFGIFIVGSLMYSGWVFVFLKRRRQLDYKRFDISSENQSGTVQLITGMQEIKLSNCEKQKRWEWERIQAKLFRYSIKSLALGQYQQLGAFFINEGKNILITFLVARSVIAGELTLGGMLAIQYIIGQLNSPIEQLVSFLQGFQDAKISLERLNEVHQMADEEPVENLFVNALPADKSIRLRNVFFSYPGAGNEPVLKNIDLDIPAGKTTAIVGMSGSGKTSLIKLLLRFHDVQKGEIKVGNINLGLIGHRYWRGSCGVVMQDGFIFSDTIARNIAVGEEYADMERLEHAVRIANIHEFIDSLPLGLSTKIGATGNGISQGQKQRILIARAVYKDPQYIFFDEATNALDANNERAIIENLASFFEGRTVLVVAHRLSTVRNADNIIVLNNGIIAESGSHSELAARKGEYYQLVKNQLELS